MKSIKFKPTAIEILADDPFKNDLLGRKESAEILTDFILSLDEPFVFTIDSPFGTGKSTFLKMWLQHARNEGIHSLYFNAWENDFNDSPLVSLIGELGAGILTLQLEGKKAKLVAQAFDKTKKAGAALLKTALPTVIKIATSGLVDVSELANLAEEVAKKQIEKYQEDKTTITYFRSQLEELVQSIAGENAKVSSPLIFVIDELDRCRPPYAIALLEKIKHFFSVRGLVFVLAIDGRQLQKSVEALYGHGFDSDGYLRRFIDLEYRLPGPDVPAFVASQFARFGLDAVLNAKPGTARHEFGFLNEVLPMLFQLFGFSLRVQEQVFTHLCVVIRTTPPKMLLYSYQLGLLICLRIVKRELYSRYIDGMATPEEVMAFLASYPQGHQLLKSRVGCALEAHLIMGIPDRGKRHAAIEIIRNKANGNPADNHAKAIVEQFAWIGRTDDNMTAYVVNKIEVAAPFMSENEG